MKPRVKPVPPSRLGHAVTCCAPSHTALCHPGAGLPLLGRGVHLGPGGMVGALSFPIGLWACRGAAIATYVTL